MRRTTETTQFCNMSPQTCPHLETDVVHQSMLDMVVSSMLVGYMETCSSTFSNFHLHYTLLLVGGPHCIPLLAPPLHFSQYLGR
jgi:hypothetical protein